MRSAETLTDSTTTTTKKRQNQPLLQKVVLEIHSPPGKGSCNPGATVPPAGIKAAPDFYRGCSGVIEKGLNAKLSKMPKDDGGVGGKRAEKPGAGGAAAVIQESQESGLIGSRGESLVSDSKVQGGDPRERERRVTAEIDIHI